MVRVGGGGLKALFAGVVVGVVVGMRCSGWVCGGCGAKWSIAVVCVTGDLRSKLLGCERRDLEGRATRAGLPTRCGAPDTSVTALILQIEDDGFMFALFWYLCITLNLQKLSLLITL